jgi:hypothetical protein
MNNLKNKKIIIFIFGIIIIMVTVLYNSKMESKQNQMTQTTSHANQQPLNSNDAKKADRVALSNMNKNQAIKKLTKKDKVYILKFAVKIDVLEKTNVKKLSESEYLILLHMGLKDFPTKNDIQKLTNKDVHTIPVPVSLAGEYLGYVSKHLKNNPRLLNSTLIFYNDCAKKGSLLVSVKALCLANFFKLSKLNNRPYDASQYDKKVIQLAKYAEMDN